jgi:hypothetical protein
MAESLWTVMLFSTIRKTDSMPNLRVPQLLPRAGDFLGKYAQMIAEAEHVFKHADRFFEVLFFVRASLSNVS